MSQHKTQQREFVNLVTASQGIIHKVCRLYCQDEEHRKDLFQEILVQLWQSFPSYRGDAKFSTWMYRVALNTAIQDFRKEKNQKLLLFESYDFKDTAEPEAQLNSDRLQELHRAISELDKVEKAIIMLHLEETPNEEIAAIVGISQNYVRVKMTRIRKKLSQKLNPN